MKRASHKYRAVRTEHNGRTYASKAEARYARFLAEDRTVLGVLEQVPFRFKCGAKYVADFLVFNVDGTCSLVDVKGMETPAFRLKQKMMASEYPWIPLVVVPAKAVPRWVSGA